MINFILGNAGLRDLLIHLFAGVLLVVFVLYKVVVAHIAYRHSCVLLPTEIVVRSFIFSLLLYFIEPLAPFVLFRFRVWQYRCNRIEAMKALVVKRWGWLDLEISSTSHGHPLLPNRLQKCAWLYTIPFFINVFF